MVKAWWFIHSSTWQSGPKGEWWVSSWLASIGLEILVQHFILCDKALFSPFITLFKRKSQRKIAAEMFISYGKLLLLKLLLLLLLSLRLKTQ